MSKFLFTFSLKIKKCSSKSDLPALHSPLSKFSRTKRRSDIRSSSSVPSKLLVITSSLSCSFTENNIFSCCRCRTSMYFVSPLSIRIATQFCVSKATIASKKCKKGLLLKAGTLDPNEKTVHLSFSPPSPLVGIIAPSQVPHWKRYEVLLLGQNQHLCGWETRVCCIIAEIG
jgi:hypothetical protein